MGYLPPLIDSHATHVEFLAVNGYFEGDFPAHKKLKESDQLFKDAAFAFQQVADLPPTGKIDAMSEARMRDKRCALPDLSRGFVLKDGKWTEWSSAAGCTRKWASKELTVTHQNLSFPTLSAVETNKAWWAAKLSWMKVCGLVLKQVPWNGAGSANVWHVAKNIDGASRTLAYQYLPGCNESAKTGTLQGVFDTSERWTFPFFQGTCAHEDGHAWGLDHTQKRGQLMYPYMENVTTPQDEDSRRAVALYDKPILLPPGPDPVPPNTPITMEQQVMRNTVMIDALWEVVSKIMSGR